MDWIRSRKFEFALLVGGLGVLLFVLLGVIERTREDVEESVVRAEAAALRVELLDRLAHRESVGGDLPESRNPLGWVSRRPEGYLGELETAPSSGGVWYFDRSRQQLIYRFRSGREACFVLVRGAEVANVQGGLAGIGLKRLDGGKLSR